MAELFAAGVGIADVAVRVIKYLKDVKAAMKTIEDEIEGLISEVEELTMIHQQLEGDYFANYWRAAPGSEENTLWHSVGHTLQKGRQLTEKLEVTVTKIYGDDPSITGKRDAFIKQHRYRSKNLIISGIRDQMATYHSVLNINLSRINMYLGREQRERQQYQFAELSKLVKDLESRLAPIPDTTSQPGDTASVAAVYKDFTALSLTVLKQITLSPPSVETKTEKPSLTNTHFYIPKPVDQFYTGRTEEAKQLTEWLLPDEVPGKEVTEDKMHTSQRRFVVYGVGGAGKTQFCCKFAVDHQNFFWAVFWVDGSSRQRLKQTFSQNISRIGGVEANENAALHWLCIQTKPWLLIIDNADDPDLLLDDYLPRGANYGHILITTRSPFNKSYGTVGKRFFEFQGLRVHEASSLLLKAAEQARPWDSTVSHLAITITKTLGYLALAITQAGRTIRNKFCKLDEYMDYYERQWKKTRQNRQVVKGNDVTDHMSVFATFELNRRAIEERDDEASRDALQLLNTFAFMHNQNIRFELLAKAVTNKKAEETQQEQNEKKESENRAIAPSVDWSAWLKNAAVRMLTFLHKNRSPPVLPSIVRAGRESKDFDPDRSRAALHQLEQFSLITQNTVTDSYSLHPLVHKWARERPDMSIAEQCVWVEAASVLISHCILLPPLGNTIEDEDIRTYLLPHVEHVRTCQASIEQRMRDKRIMRVNPFPIFEPTFNREKALMYAKFSIVYAQNGRYEEAKRLQMVVKDFLMKMVGMKYANTRRITLALANTMLLLGQSDDAAALQEEVLDACSTFLGPHSLETLTTKCKLGSSRYSQGRFTDAKQLLHEAVTDLERHYGSLHEETLEAKDSLGRVVIMFRTPDSFKQAQKLHLEAVEGMQHVHGHQHTRTLTAHENLCMAFVESGDHMRMTETLNTMTEVLEVRKEKLGREHGFTLIAMLNLSRVKIAMGDLEGAESLLEEGLKVGERNYGPDHVGCLWGRSLIAKIWIQQEKWRDAERLLVDNTQRQHNLLQGRGKYHPDRLDGLVMLAAVYNALGQLDDCIRVADEALEGFKRIEGSNHPVARRLEEDKKQWMGQASVDEGNTASLLKSRSHTF